MDKPMIKYLVTFILITLLLVVLVSYAGTHAIVLRGSNEDAERVVVSVAVVGKNATLRSWIVKMLRTLGVKNVSDHARLSELLGKHVDVIILLNDDDNEVLLKYLEEGKTVVIPAKVYVDSVKPILKRRSLVYASFNGTPTYAVRLLKALGNGKYVTAIYGIAEEITSKKALHELIKWHLKTEKLKTIKIASFKATPKQREGQRHHDLNLSTITATRVIKVPSFYSSSTPYWIVVGYISWSSGDAWYPYGRLNVEHKIWYLVNDGNPDMDWYIVDCITQGIPGVEIYGTDWYLEDFYNHYYLKYYTNIYELRDYDPTSMTNPVSISVVLSGNAGVVVSWTYPGNYINRISDDSDFWTDVAGWWHDIATSSETIKIEPGFEFTVSPIQTGKQKWVISAQWGTRGIFQSMFKGTVVIDVVFQYSS